MQQWCRLFTIALPQLITFQTCMLRFVLTTDIVSLLVVCQSISTRNCRNLKHCMPSIWENVFYKPPGLQVIVVVKYTMVVYSRPVILKIEFVSKKSIYYLHLYCHYTPNTLPYFNKGKGRTQPYNNSLIIQLIWLNHWWSSHNNTVTSAICSSSKGKHIFQTQTNSI